MIVLLLLLFSCSVVTLFATLWTVAPQASLSFTISLGLLKLMSIESVMTHSHLLLYHPLLLLPSIFPTIRVFSNESDLHLRWPKYWSFSFSINPSNEYSRLISFRINWFDFLAVQGTLFSISWENELYCYRTKIPKTLVTCKNCNMYFTREPAMGPETACVVVSTLLHGLVCLVVDAGSDLSCGLWLECLQVTYPYRCLVFSECGGTLRVRQSCVAPKWKSIISGILFSRIKSPRIIYTQELEGQVSRKYTDVLKPPSIGLN